jgi:hypothetical protein
VGLVGASTIFSCLEPTEIRLELSTDICDLTSVKIWTTDETLPLTDVPVTVDPSCTTTTKGKIGTLVLVPSHHGDSFVVNVAGARKRGNYTLGNGVVRASRRVSFLAHTALDLPVELERSCVDVDCKDPSKTCVNGQCVDNSATCNNKSCGVQDGGADDASDAGSCNAGLTRLNIPNAIPVAFWTFEGGSGNRVFEGKSQTPSDPFPNPSWGFTTHPTCGQALSMETGSMRLNVNSPAQGGVAVAFELNVPNDTMQYIPVLETNSSPGGNWSVDIEVDTTTTRHVQLQLDRPTADGESMLLSAPDPYSFSTNEWHHIEVAINASGSVQFAIDQNIQSGKVAVGPPGNGALMLDSHVTSGSTQRVLIDELHVYQIP